MNWINNYLFNAVYVDGGRGPAEYDCWGLVREARHLHCGKRLLPSYGEVRHTMPREFTQACEREAETMMECGPEHGAIATAYIGRICVHVGLVVDTPRGLHVLEINHMRGVNFSRVLDFSDQYRKVIYYRD